VPAKSFDVVVQIIANNEDNIGTFIFIVFFAAVAEVVAIAMTRPTQISKRYECFDTERYIIEPNCS